MRTNDLTNVLRRAGLWFALTATAGAQVPGQVHPAAARAWRTDHPLDALVWTAPGAPVDQARSFEPTGTTIGELVQPPADPRVQSALRDPQEIFASPVEVNWQVLDALVPGAPQRVGIPLPEGGSLELVLVTSESRGPTRFTWYGQIAGIANSLVLLVRHDDAVRAIVTNVNAHGRTLGIRACAAGHLLTEEGQLVGECAGPPAFAASEPPPVRRPSGGSRENLGGPGADPTNQIDIMVVASDQSRAAYGSYNAFIADSFAMVADTNFRVSASLGGWSYRLCAAPWTLITGYVERSDVTKDLYELTYPVGTVVGAYTTTDSTTDAVQAQRNDFRPDLIALLVETYSGSIGVAWRPTSPSVGAGYSVTVRSKAISNAVFAHEIGHNLCACHNATSSAPSCTSPYTPTPRGKSATADVPDGFCGGCEDAEIYTTMAILSDGSVNEHVQVQRYSVMGLTATLTGSFGSDTVDLWDGESQSILTQDAARILASNFNVAVTQIWAIPGVGGAHNGTWQEPAATVKSASQLVGGTPEQAIVRARGGNYGETAANGGPVVINSACTIVPDQGVVVLQ